MLKQTCPIKSSVPTSELLYNLLGGKCWATAMCIFTCQTSASVASSDPVSSWKGLLVFVHPTLGVVRIKFCQFSGWKVTSHYFILHLPVWPIIWEVSNTREGVNPFISQNWCSVAGSEGNVSRTTFLPASFIFFPLLPPLHSIPFQNHCSEIVDKYS